MSCKECRPVSYTIPCVECGEPHHASGGSLCMPCYLRAKAARFRAYAAEPGLAYARNVLLDEAVRLEDEADG